MPTPFNTTNGGKVFNAADWSWSLPPSPGFGPTPGQIAGLTGIASRAGNFGTQGATPGLEQTLRDLTLQLVYGSSNLPPPRLAADAIVPLPDVPTQGAIPSISNLTRQPQPLGPTPGMTLARPPGRPAMGAAVRPVTQGPTSRTSERGGSFAGEVLGPLKTPVINDPRFQAQLEYTANAFGVAALSTSIVAPPLAFIFGSLALFTKGVEWSFFPPSLQGLLVESLTTGLHFPASKSGLNETLDFLSDQMIVDLNKRAERRGLGQSYFRTLNKIILENQRYGLPPPGLTP